MPQKTEQPPRRATFGDLSVQPVVTDIDRRKCSRVVPMEVMCLGLSRTGTASMRQALIDLGYDDCYHYASLLQENPRDCEMWNDAFEWKFRGKGKPFERKDWDQLLGHCMALTDTPCSLFSEELLAAYPDAKVILTVRDNADVWYKSINGTLMERMWTVRRWGPTTSIFRQIERLFLPLSKTMIRFNKLIYSTPFYTNMDKSGKEYYNKHNEQIKLLVPPDNLLVFNVKEGWEPLCKFLGKEIPPWDFPKTNEAEALNRSLDSFIQYLDGETRRRMRVAGFWMAMAVLGVLGAFTMKYSAFGRAFLDLTVQKLRG